MEKAKTNFRQMAKEEVLKQMENIEYTPETIRGIISDIAKEGKFTTACILTLRALRDVELDREAKG